MATGRTGRRTARIISHLWDRKWGRKSVLRGGTTTMLGTLRGRRRYLEIINHIVTRVARETAKGSARRTRRDERHKLHRLHGLIWHLNQFPVINYGLCPSPTITSSSFSVLRQPRGARFRDPRRRRHHCPRCYNAVSTRSRSHFPWAWSLIIIYRSAKVSLEARQWALTSRESLHSDAISIILVNFIKRMENKSIFHE